MDDLPETIRKSIPASLIGEAEAWWQTLTEADRSELQRLCDAKKELFLFETLSDSSDIKIRGGRFVSDDDCRGFDEWGEDYFDYLLGNPELLLVHDPDNRTFHIGCTRHQLALQCYSNGHIHKSFQCPYEDSSCRMRAILRGRSSLTVNPMIESTNKKLQPSARSAVSTCVESSTRTG